MDSFIGIDISKRSLDVAMHETGESYSYDNDEEGIGTLALQLKNLRPTLVVMESTGGYERELCYALLEHNIPVSVVNARQVRDFAKAMGKLAKTDKIDAAVIAHFASVVAPRESNGISISADELSGKLLRRRQLVEMRMQEKCRREMSRGLVRKDIDENIAALTARIKKIEKDLDQELKGKFNDELKLLRSAPGIGPESARTLLIEMPELGRLNRREIASLAGLAPFNVDSGTMRGKRHIRGGREVVRRALFLAANGARRSNAQFKEHYEALRKRGKAHKVALIACARKLLTALNAMMASKTNWTKKEAVA